MSLIRQFFFLSPVWGKQFSWKICISAEFWRPEDIWALNQCIEGRRALCDAWSVKNFRRLWSLISITCVPKIYFSIFFQCEHNCVSVLFSSITFLTLREIFTYKSDEGVRVRFHHFGIGKHLLHTVKYLHRK